MAAEQRELARRSSARTRLSRPAKSRALRRIRGRRLPGRFVAQGLTSRVCRARRAPIVRVVVPQDDIDLVRNRLVRVEVRLAGRWPSRSGAKIVREVPAAQDELPSKALSSRAAAAPSPSIRANQGRQGARQRLFQFDLELPPARRQRRRSATASTCASTTAPSRSAQQCYRSVRQALPGALQCLSIALAAPAPRSPLAPYPERADERELGARPTPARRCSARAQARRRALALRRAAAVALIAERCAAGRATALSDEELRARARTRCGRAAAARALPRQLVAAGFCAGARSGRAQRGLRHYPVQLIGGCAMLRRHARRDGDRRRQDPHRDAARRDRGAGRACRCMSSPSTTTSPSATPKRMRPVYEALGLTVGVVAAGQEPESARAAYACDITYCTNKELAFDYLRDRLALGRARGDACACWLDALHGRGDRAGRLLLRGLAFRHRRRGRQRAGRRGAHAADHVGETEDATEARALYRGARASRASSDAGARLSCSSARASASS